MRSLNPLRSTIVADNMPNVMLRYIISIATSGSVATCWAIAHFCCSVSCRSLLHTRPPVQGAQACGQRLQQECRTHCFHEGVSQATPNAMLLWLLPQWRLLLQFPRSSPHVVCFDALVITGLRCQGELTGNCCARYTGLYGYQSARCVEIAC